MLLGADQISKETGSNIDNQQTTNRLLSCSSTFLPPSQRHQPAHAMAAVLDFLRDLIAFANQFFPHPIAILRSYRFSPTDLAIEPQPSLDEQLSSPSLPRSTIDVLSYNINNEAVHNPTRRRRIIRAIFSSGAHIILLQETNEVWEELLREDAVALEYVYTYFHHPKSSDRKAGGSAILSQLPIDMNSIQIIDFSNKVVGSVFPVMVCDVSIPRHHLNGSKQRIVDTSSSMQRSSSSSSSNDDIPVAITIANLHLRPPVKLDGSARLDTARKTEPIRIAEVKELLHHRPQEESLKRSIDIIAGDFNEGDYGGAIRYLVQEEDYTNALTQHVPRSKETHRWNYFGSFWQLRKRLDHILWLNKIKSSSSSRQRHDGKEDELSLDCINCGVLSGYEYKASDHQPVLARFAINIQDRISNK